MKIFWRAIGAVWLFPGLFAGPHAHLWAQELSPERVRLAISRGQNFLKSRQNADGSFSYAGVGGHTVGVTGLALLALMNSGLSPNDPAVRKGLQFLRKTELPEETYDIALMLMALAAAKDGTDNFRMQQLVNRLEAGQVKAGNGLGGWSYLCSKRNFALNRPDRSNSQFAVLALRDAVYAGLTVQRATWERVKTYWEGGQEADGGWKYVPQSRFSTGSMTVAGIAALVIVQRMLETGKDFQPDGSPVCCRERNTYRPLQRGLTWLSRNLNSIGRNPLSGRNTLYWLYGLERAGRLSGRRFFGRHDWYREGVRYLVFGRARQARDGSWTGNGHGEADRAVATSMALLFLAKGLAPVLINKLKYGPPQENNPDEVADDNWNRHPHDVRNITEYISTRKNWPSLLTWQTVEMRKLVRHATVDEAVSVLEQAKVLYIAGRDAPQTILADERQIRILRKYIDRGGFILAVASCGPRNEFDKGFRQLVRKIFQQKDDAGVIRQIAELSRLPKGHPVYRSEHQLIDHYEELELWGVEYGCRTPLIYVPVQQENGRFDLGCLWDKWSLHGRNIRHPLSQRLMSLALRLGENILAYATGREPPQKLLVDQTGGQKGVADHIQRGLLQVAKIIHAGDWNAAPRALRNLLIGMNRAHGLTASTQPRPLRPSDKNIFRYPVLYMHGRNEFTLSKPARDELKKYLAQRGGLLFADACCGSPAFDKSFRELMAELFPGKPFRRIPVSHELFTTKIGFDLRKVTRRMPETKNLNAKLTTTTVTGPPFLEGIEIDGRYVVIYSKYDISCALERQASLACAGYTEKDAMRIGINILSYALLQDVRYSEYLK